MKEMISGETRPGFAPVLPIPIRRAGLLSSTSANLGNAAMQWAMISNLRKRAGDVAILGITLNPEETRRRHGIETFPLAFASRPYYSPFDSSASDAPKPNTPKPGGIRQWLKKIPVPGHVLRFIRDCLLACAPPATKRVARRVAGFVRTCIIELKHIRAAARVVRKLDCIIIPGGGSLDDFWGGPWGQPWALFKWSTLCRLHGVPFLFVSIGKCSLESPVSRFFARIALRFAKYRSYRDPDSKKGVQTLIDARRDPVYPDLAFSYPSPAIVTRRSDSLEDGRMVVGVSPIAYCDPRYWPRKDERRYTAYISQLTQVVKWLIKERHRVLFFTTDGTDAATVEDIQSLLPGGMLDPEMIETLPGSAKQSPDSLLRGIARADLVIASRLHAVILSHLESIPVLALSFDPKVDAHMNSVGQQAYCLNIDQWQPETLIDRFNVLKAFREREAEHIHCAALAFRQRLESQYDQIFGEVCFDPVGDTRQNLAEVFHPNAK